MKTTLIIVAAIMLAPNAARCAEFEKDTYYNCYSDNINVLEDDAHLIVYFPNNIPRVNIGRFSRRDDDLSYCALGNMGTMRDINIYSTLTFLKEQTEGFSSFISPSEIKIAGNIEEVKKHADESCDRYLPNLRGLKYMSPMASSGKIPSLMILTETGVTIYHCLKLQTKER